MLKGVQSKGDEACRNVGTPDPEHAALLAQLVAIWIERIGRQHVPGPRALKQNRDIGASTPFVACCMNRV
jgi:hypothetical protein